MTSGPEQGSDGVTGIARKAIPFMSQKHIPLSPDNYRIWFEYSRGSMTELIEAIDDLLNKNVHFSEQVHHDLFRRFLRRDTRSEDEKKMQAEMIAIDRANKESRDILDPVARDLEGLSESNSEYGDRLQGFAAQVTTTGDIGELKDVISSLVDATTKISSESQRMSVELEKSSAQLERFRKNLEQAREQARLDDLTRLQNRRAFNETIAKELARVKRDGATSCLALMDIDHFKRINDTYGHPVGDKALRAIAGQLNSSLRPNDLLYRYGGEEFAIIMRNIALKDGVRRVDQLRAEIAEHEFVIRDCLEKITVSFGVAAIAPDSTEDTCQKRADDALYVAKRAGRNLVRSELDLKEENASRA